MKYAADDALLQAWEKTHARLSGQPAVFGADGAPLRTFGAIAAEAEAIGETLLARAREGEVVAIQIGNHESWPAAFLACLRRSTVVVPLEATITTQERAAAMRACRAAHLLTLDNGKVVATAVVPERVDWNGARPALMKLTSGTTAAPRAIRFRSEQLIADCEQICDTMEIADRDLNFGVVPVSHSYGFSNLLTPLLVRGVPMVISRDRMPRAIVDGLLRTEATVFPGMPVFYQALCELEDVPPLPALRLCISAGAPLQLEVARTFRSKFGLPIHSFYGSSECGGICYDREALLVHEGFVGGPMNGVALEPLDDTGDASLVRVRTAAAGDAYFPERDDAKLGGGMFTPDDLLAPVDDGFRIVGRLSDLINVAGKKVNPAEVEAQLLTFDGVRAAVVFGRPSALRNEEVAACVVGLHEGREHELLEHCRRHLSGWQVPKRIYFVDEILVNERGKISRRALAERFR